MTTWYRVRIANRWRPAYINETGAAYVSPDEGARWREATADERAAFEWRLSQGTSGGIRDDEGYAPADVTEAARVVREIAPDAHPIKYAGRWAIETTAGIPTRVFRVFRVFGVESWLIPVDVDTYLIGSEL